MVLVAWGAWVTLSPALRATCSPVDREWYATQAVQQGWSRLTLELNIRNRLHVRQGVAVTNFVTRLPAQDSALAIATLKDPYLFDFLGLGNDAHEREIEDGLIRHITRFLLELGAAPKAYETLTTDKAGLGILLQYTSPVATRTRTCAEAAVRNGVRNFVLISTDKAVRPTNIMGATKRLAEMVLQALAEVGAAVAAQGGRVPSAKTTFSMVRFGNVLGSSGSVVPLFREQIKNGGPITLTHADITRYFMTIPEAAQLVIQAGAMGQGGDVFVLDMGQPVKIIDLARRMVELSGLSVRDEARPDGDIEIAVAGLRPGEKLFEELLIGDNPKPTQHARIMKAHEPFLPWAQLEQKLNALSIAMSVNDVPVIRGMLQQLVSGYQPSSEVVDWVHMAQEREAQANE
jgi:hypothetical protein